MLSASVCLFLSLSSQAGAVPPTVVPGGSGGVYGPEADDLIRGISEFSSKYELYEWWNAEIKGCTDPDEVARKAQARFQELFQRSNMSGWKST